ncbi:NemA protein [Neisseria canis]|uniref:Lipoprotein n=1 Tax=Neisseria canis TaxID=493 RepID=A0A448D8S5_9NEIS|nr:NemA protein [Neisseria canis]OSI13270.1 NemA protein [Neisseria canis]VEF01774.1 lipoprotein [Neisseria canis]
MKAYIPFLLLPFLAACSSGPSGMSVNLGIGSRIGSHVGLGTSVNIPVGIPGKKSDSGINVIEEQIIAHFDAKGNTSDAAVKGGFYRQLISKRNDNEYIVQDFYEGHAKKRSDPMVLTRKQLLDFNAHPLDGTLTIYAYNGNIMYQQTYQNGKLISAKY